VITEKGRGYGKGTVKLVKRLAFENYKAHRLWLDVKEQNHRARTVYKSAGFTVEGILRECLSSVNGYESLVVMSILEREYDQAK
jgi:diamine N-acetyltransferase